MPKERDEIDRGNPLSVDPPLSATANEGMEEGRALARRYLANVVKLQAAIAFGHNSEAGLHTRMLAAKSIADIAGAIPQSTPTAPSFESHGSGQA
jgi:hypothetical protein